MSGIFVVAFVVHCGQNLLLCDAIDTGALRFRDMESCRARIGDLIAEQRRSTGGPGVVMGECRYRRIDPRRVPRVVRAPAPRCLQSHVPALAVNRRQEVAD